MSIKVKIGKESTTIPYSIGVQQGNNMAPVLFLFVMQAFTDMIEKNWSQLNLKPLQFNFFSQIKGRLLAQPTRSRGDLLDLIHLLYVDDGRFLFETRDVLEKGSQLIYNTFNMLGLSMHVGSNNEKSKSEAMHIEDETQILTQKKL
jgi:hypothetical protein